MVVLVNVTNCQATVKHGTCWPVNTLLTGVETGSIMQVIRMEVSLEDACTVKKPSHLKGVQVSVHDTEPLEKQNDSCTYVCVCTFYADFCLQLKVREGS